MPRFATPEPVALHVDVSGATLRLRATATDETVVEVRPHNPARQGDVDAAARVTVDHTPGRVIVRSPRTGLGRLRSLFGGGDRVDVEVALPEGSALDVRGWGEVVATGALGVVDVDSQMGDISLERVEKVAARTEMGDVRVERVAGDADLRTSMGAVGVGDAGGHVVARTSAGDVSVGRVQGSVRASTSMGDVRVEHPGTDVVAKTSAGDVRIRRVEGGLVTVDSTYGRVDIGVAEGVAAWLDVEARHGAVRSELTELGAPAEGDPTVELRVRAGYGDVVLHRA
ncbi:DUF4097 family beta strand repeat-containing protein [Oryzobacter sp. R7]|uniref:DUF4097 family beta strand repeat-containing protein n=1 Tax=Oryzobacter faecalis TaxID=3388656 RepID=UPI00398D5002